MLLVAARTLLPVGNVPRRDLPVQDPLQSHSSAVLCPSRWPFGRGLLPPLPASSPGSLPGALGPTAQKGRRIYLVMRFLLQLFLPDSVFPERMLFSSQTACWAGQGEVPAARSLLLIFPRGRGRAAPWRKAVGPQQPLAFRAALLSFIPPPLALRQMEIIKMAQTQGLEAAQQLCCAVLTLLLLCAMLA